MPTEQLSRTQVPPEQQWWVDDPRVAEIVAEQASDLPPIPKLTPEQSTQLHQDVRKDLADSVTAGEPLDSKYHSALEALSVGWKAHLNFDPTDEAAVEKVRSTLDEMKDQGLFSAYKIGRGGGQESGQPGKESTVYVGSKARLDEVSGLLEQRLGDTLLPTDPEVLNDDIAVNSLVAARFDVHQIDDRFSQYGARGHPKLQADLDPWNQTRSSEVATLAAQQALEKTYGEYFTV